MHSRRNFLASIIKAGAAAMILPAAVTYSRKWTFTRGFWKMNPEWLDAPYEMRFFVAPKPFEDYGRYLVVPILEDRIKNPSPSPKAIDSLGQAWPLRYNSKNFAGQPIPPVIFVRS